MTTICQIIFKKCKICLINERENVLGLYIKEEHTNADEKCDRN